MKVILGLDFGEEFVEDLGASFPEVKFVRAKSVEEQLREIEDAEVYFGLPPKEVFLAAKSLRWLQYHGTGIDLLLDTLPEIVQSDVILTNVRGPHANPMADHVFAMMLALAHHIPELSQDQRAHRWQLDKYEGEMVELDGATIGIHGLGDIGLALARRAHGFGMEVYAVDILPQSPPSEVREVWGEDKLDELIGLSDWFVITLPLTAQTHGLIDRRRIGLMKPGAYIIVISRGGIVDEEALVEALRSGGIAGAGLDVMAEEPLPSASPLWDLDNVILSPHASALSSRMREGRKRIIKENLQRYLAGEPFLYICDKKAGF